MAVKCVIIYHYYVYLSTFIIVRSFLAWSKRAREYIRRPLDSHQRPDRQCTREKQTYEIHFAWHLHGALLCPAESHALIFGGNVERVCVCMVYALVPLAS